MLENKLIARHDRGYPWKTIRSFRDASYIPTIIKDAREPCQKNFIDKWTRSLVRRFPTADAFQSQECRACIMLYLMVMWACVTAIESLHASIRRNICGYELSDMVAKLRSGWS